jgi:phosphopantothenoylcysteine decarboxylase/phosphopantothenate--cysteine ligase
MKSRLRVLISAGPTREPIDPVRFLSNESTGYMGARLAAEALARGHRVTVVHGPIAEPLPHGIRREAVVTSADLEQALRRHAPEADVVIMAAAVADFRPARVAAAKLPRRGRLTLRLRATPDLIGRLPRRPGQLVVGFALETGRALSRARRKLAEKRLDLLVAQQANGTSPFGRRRVKAWLLARE